MIYNQIVTWTAFVILAMFIYESEEYVNGMPIDKVVEEEVKDKELEASKDYTGLIPEVEYPSSSYFDLGHPVS